MASNCFGFLEEDFGSCFDMLFESQVQEQERNTSCFANGTARPMPLTSPSASLMKDYKNDDCFENVVAAVNINKILPRKLGGNNMSKAENLKSEEEIDKFIKGQKAKQTVYKDRTDMNKLTAFLATHNENREIRDIPAKQLNSLLCSFFMTVRRNDGKKYEPDTLSSFFQTYQRILSERGSQVNMKNDYEFESCRRVLAAKRKQLTKKGLGNKPNAARELQDEEIDLLFKKGFLKHRNPPWHSKGLFGGQCHYILASEHAKKQKDGVGRCFSCSRERKRNTHLVNRKRNQDKNWSQSPGSQTKI